MILTRFLDIGAATVGLTVLSPVLFVVAILVRIDSRGPSLFRQTRVGRHGRRFTILKFRTMTVAGGEPGSKVTAAGDARVTRLGKWLRRAKLDELPQLWNVLRGDMSLVGPRPEVPDYVALYSPDQRRVLSVRPGMTSRASLLFLNEEDLLAKADDPSDYYQREILPKKLELMLADVAGASVREYFHVIFCTIGRVLTPRTDASTHEDRIGFGELVEDHGLKGLAVEWYSAELTLASKRNRLYRYERGALTKNTMATFPAPVWRRLIARSRLGQRLLRFSYYNVLPLSDGRLFATFDRQIGIQRGDRFESVRGVTRPTRVLRGGCALTHDDRVYFGEYRANPERGPIHVYEFDASTNHARVVRTFSPGTIRHVHGVHHDRHTGDLYCVTGDLPTECRMYRTTDRFETLQTIGSGDESWRCVALVGTTDSIWYATDAEHQQNKVFRIDRETGVRVEVGDLPGPVYSGRETADGVLFAVAAEHCPSQRDGCASIWSVSKDGRLECVARCKKDSWPNRYFQHGLMNFGGGEWDSPVMINTVALHRADNRVFRSRLAA